MWISITKKWANSSTPLERFAVERFVQRCDYSEIITNKHRSTNGYTQLKDLIKYGNLSFKRGRTVKTLIAMLEESKSIHIKQNIRHDWVVATYFSDLKDFIIQYDPKTLLGSNSQPNLTELQNLLFKLRVFEVQLDKFYFQSTIDEFLKIDYASQNFDRTSSLISELIDLIIPYLVFHGYSISSIKGLLTRWCHLEYHITIKKLIGSFSFKPEDLSFYYLLDDTSQEYPFLLEILKSHVNTSIFEKTAGDIGDKFCTKFGLTGAETLVLYHYKTIDPHNHVRSSYNILLKQLVHKRERQSLKVFNEFFSNAYWSHRNNVGRIHKVILDGDSINVNSRAHTLRSTLTRCEINENFREETSIPVTDLNQLNNAIFYYNLALGSKSIENSLSLLWTSLEAILPFRASLSDIESVQHWVSKCLGCGALSRDIHSFSSRFIQQNFHNDNTISDLGTIGFESNFTQKGLKSWFKWLIDESIAKKHFDTVKRSSELLAYQYFHIGKKYSEESLDFLLNRLKSSQESIKFQLQRIYIHRNQIVHSGDLINEYSNLWTHLEWYVGKLLSYFLIELHFNKNFDDLESAALRIESDYDYLLSYCEKNKKKKLNELPERVSDILFRYNWQYF